MRRARVAFLSILSCLLAFGPALAAGPEYPLAGSKIEVADGKNPKKRKVAFKGAWTGTLDGIPDPNFAGATLRISGGPGEGSSGLIRLGPNWRQLPKGKGWKYADKRGVAGGIRQVVLKSRKSGGTMSIVGGKERWAYEVTGPQSTVAVTLRLGDARFCAVFANVSTKKGKVVGKGSPAPATCPCETYDTTFEAIQAVIFERNGCTQEACHGAAAQGGLKLTADVAYDNLVNVLSPLAGAKRVQPGSPKDSFLYRKLATSTLGPEAAKLATVAIDGDEGSPMPSGLPPISKEELEALRLWIQYGAQRDVSTPGTQDLLDSCLPPPSPPQIEPPAAPDPSVGVQLQAPPWTVAPKNTREGYNGENEVCYPTYYNLRPLVESGVIPEDIVGPCSDFMGGPAKQCIHYKRQELTQDPNSHHSIIHIYTGAYNLYSDGGLYTPEQLAENAALWEFQCHGGSQHGMACNPTQPDVAAPTGGLCADGGQCHGKVKTSLACTFDPSSPDGDFGYGPPDFNAGGGVGDGPTAPQFSGSQQPYLERRYPDGVFSQLPIEGVIVWNSHAFNVTDAPVTNQQWLNLYFARQAERKYPLYGIFDARDIFVQNVPPFEKRTYCRTVTFDKGTRITDFSSHTHKRGKIFQLWGPGIPVPCSSRDGDVCNPEPTTPIMVTHSYNDPAQLRFDPPLALDGDAPASRRFKFCAVFDNGADDPNEVKRNSLSPPNSNFLGGKCYYQQSPGVFRDEGIMCLNGPKKGKPCGCGGSTCPQPASAYDSKCDSSPGAGDGICDACQLRGGVTTEDEMFILLGSYYCAAGAGGCDTTYTK
jgi:hypothetical protein